MEFSEVRVKEEVVNDRKKKFNFFSKKQRADYLSRWRESGLSQTAFCESHQIKLSTFNAWLKKEGVIKKKRDSEIQISNREPISEQGEKKTATNQFELKFPNGCSLVFSSRSEISQLGLIARELLCKWY